MNLRDATVLGLVGAGGIGAPLIFAMNSLSMVRGWFDFNWLNIVYFNRRIYI